MEYSYKFRIYPNIHQEHQIWRTFGCCRFVFNHYLNERIEAYKETGKSPTRFQQDKNLTALKQQEETKVGWDKPEANAWKDDVRLVYLTGKCRRIKNPPTLVVGSVKG